MSTLWVIMQPKALMPYSLNSDGGGDPRKAPKNGGVWGGGTLVAYIVHLIHGRPEANFFTVCGI